MESNKVKIIPLKVVNYKNKKGSLFEYAIACDENDYCKGLDVQTSYYDDDRAFKLPKELILKPLDATFEWKKSYNGTAKMHITSVFDEKGEVIFG